MSTVPIGIIAKRSQSGEFFEAKPIYREDDAKISDSILEDFAALIYQKIKSAKTDTKGGQII